MDCARGNACSGEGISFLPNPNNPIDFDSNFDAYFTLLNLF